MIKQSNEQMAIDKGEIKSLEYSEYDRRIKEYEDWLAGRKECLALVEERLEEAKRTRESLVEQAGGDGNKAKALLETRDWLIGLFETEVASHKRVIGKIESLIEITKQLKEKAGEVLQKGEHLDPLTADIELEDEPERPIN